MSHLTFILHIVVCSTVYCLTYLHDTVMTADTEQLQLALHQQEEMYHAAVAHSAYAIIE